MNSYAALEVALGIAFCNNCFNGFDASEPVEVELPRPLTKRDVTNATGATCALDLCEDVPMYDNRFDDADDYETYEEFDLTDDMDGDAASALASAGWGTDEDYGCYGDEGY